MTIKERFGDIEEFAGTPLLAAIQIHSAIFRDRAISGLEIRNAVFTRCDFKSVSLSGIKFTDTRFESCLFEGATFSKADFEGVYFGDCHLEGVTFTEATFEDCLMTSMHEYESAMELDAVDFSGCDLRGLHMERLSRLEGVIVEGAQILAPSSTLEFYGDDLVGRPVLVRED